MQAGKKGIVFWVGVFAGSLVLVVLLTYVLFEGFPRWKAQRDVANSCSGQLAVAEIRDVLNSDDLKTGTYAGGSGIYWEQVCVISPWEGDESEVRVAIGYMNQLEYISRTTPGIGREVPAAIGHGWSGFVAADERAASATVTVRCGETEDLIVRADYEAADRGERGDDAPDPTSADYAALTRVATGTAANVAADQQCESELGGEVNELDVPSLDDAVPVQQADGLCGSLPGFQELASTLGVVSVVDGSAGSAPLSGCRLQLSDDGQTYVLLSASYGGYAVEETRHTVELAESASGVAEEDSQVVRAWAQAECPAPFRIGRYALRVVAEEGSPAYSREQRAVQRELLASFARAEAERYGCSELRVP